MDVHKANVDTLWLASGVVINITKGTKMGTQHFWSKASCNFEVLLKEALNTQ